MYRQQDATFKRLYLQFQMYHTEIVLQVRLAASKYINAMQMLLVRMIYKNNHSDV